MQAEITENIAKAHEDLSPVSLRFIRYATENPEMLKRSAFQRHLILSEEGRKMQPWPCFLGKRKKQEVETVNREVLKLIRAIPERIFDNDYHKIATYYEIHPGIVEYFLTGANRFHLDNLLARGDYIFSASGIQCIEFNIAGKLGGLDISRRERAAMYVPEMSKFLKKYNITPQNEELYHLLFRHFVECAQHLTGDDGDEINAALVWPGYNPAVQNQMELILDQFYQSFIRDSYPGKSGRFFFCDYPHFQVTEDSLIYKNKPIHVLHEYYAGFVPQPILNLFEKRKLVIFNSPVTALMTNKLNMAVLSEQENSGIFTPDEQQIIRSHIPWTRKVVSGETDFKGKTVRMEEFLLENREQLILKPSIGLGGMDVHIGLAAPADLWQRTVERALQSFDWKSVDIGHGKQMTPQRWEELIRLAGNKGNWVVQEYVESLPYLFQYGEDGCSPHDVVWGFFMFGNTYAGGMVRLLPKGNINAINTHAGAETTVILEAGD
jgi:hypothetical protein